MNTSLQLQQIMDTTYPPGPNQLWVPKENSESQPIMSTKKKTTSPNQLWALRDNECIYACDTWLLTPQNRSLTMSIQPN